MTIYDALEKCKYGLNFTDEEHDQLAEWLEELKRLRELLDERLHEKLIYSKAKKDSYNNVIEDFKKILTIEKIKEYAESDGFININNCSLMIFDIAEQLKEKIE